MDKATPARAEADLHGWEGPSQSPGQVGRASLGAALITEPWQGGQGRQGLPVGSD